MSCNLDADRIAQLVDRANGTDVFDALRAVAELREVVRRAEDTGMASALDQGKSYATIARVLGVSRQSVRIKFLARLATGDTVPRADRLAAAVAEWEGRQRLLAEDLAAYFERARRPQEPT